MKYSVKQKVLSLAVARVIRNVSIAISLVLIVSFWALCKSMGI